MKWVEPVNKLVWPPIASALSAARQWLSGPVLLHRWSAIAIGLTLVIAGAFVVFLRLVIIQKRASEPAMTDYVTDEFFGLRWHWTWFGNSLRDLDPFCLHDDTRLDEDLTGKLNYRCYLDCDSCGQKLKFPDTLDGLREKVARQIERKIRTGESRDAVLTERERIRSLHASRLRP